MTRKLQGILPIVHTPFTASDEIDWASFEQQIEWALSRGADGCCTGMVSEILRLTMEERRELTRRLIQLCKNRGVVVASVGAESLRQAVEFARHAEQVGCHALMATPPMCTRLPSTELVAYFRGLVESVDVPLVVQDASAYVGQAIPLDVHVELLETYGPERILFKPEASPTGPRLTALRDATGGLARVFDGSGGICLVDCYRRGVVGTMPGMEFLDGIVALWRALQRGDEDAVYRLYFPICALVALQMQAGLDGFLAIEKYVLVKRGLFSSDVRRRPHAWDLDVESRDEVDRLLRRLDDALAVEAAR